MTSTVLYVQFNPPTVFNQVSPQISITYLLQHSRLKLLNGPLIISVKSAVMEKYLLPQLQRNKFKLLSALFNAIVFSNKKIHFIHFLTFLQLEKSQKSTIKVISLSQTEQCRFLQLH